MLSQADPAAEVDAASREWENGRLVSVAIARGCQIKRLFLSCGAEAIGFCQYCGRHFCAEHGVLLEEHQEVCARKPCVAKREDVARHLVYCQFVRERNDTRRCGLAECEGEVATQCSRCRGYFCASHTDVRDETVAEGGRPVSRRRSLCTHCWLRRPIWQRK